MIQIAPFCPYLLHCLNRMLLRVGLGHDGCNHHFYMLTKDRYLMYIDKRLDANVIGLIVSAHNVLVMAMILYRYRDGFGILQVHCAVRLEPDFLKPTF